MENIIIALGVVLGPLALTPSRLLPPGSTLTAFGAWYPRAVPAIVTRDGGRLLAYVYDTRPRVEVAGHRGEVRWAAAGGFIGVNFDRDPLHTVHEYQRTSVRVLGGGMLLLQLEALMAGNPAVQADLDAEPVA